MKSVPLGEIARWAGGALVQGVPSDTVASVSTDSRRVEPGDLFVALKGERFDAHRFLGDVAEKGAGALLVSSLEAETESYEGGIVHVRDTLEALQRLAFHHRRSDPDLFAVGVTGSNGKTSTKDLLRATLSGLGPVNATEGNLNNHIGLPLTILSGSGDERFGVWEMGMNHPGEIEVLAEIAGPDAAVITNIGTAHIENLGTREAIAAEKAELALAVPASGYCVMPAADEFFGFVSERLSCEMIPVGIERGQVRASNVTVEEGGGTSFTLESDFGKSVPVKLPFRGSHMVINALLAAAVGLRQGLDPAAVAERLSGAELTAGRLQVRRAGGFSFLDDSYNANPDSMGAALQTLKESTVPGRRVAVLGYMGELGEHEENEHRELGKRVVERGVDALITVGERAALINRSAGDLPTNRNFPTHEEAADFLRGFLDEDDLVLVKGSRTARMERVIEELN